jgi:hypothetical protein
MLTIHASLHYFGLYSIIFFVCVTVLLMAVWHEDNAITLSKHIAKHKTAYLIFAISSVIGQAMFLLYMLGWFIPTYQLGGVLAMFMVLGAFCQLLAAWVPDTKGWASKVHHLAAYTMAIIMYGFTIWIALSPTVPAIGRLFALAGFGGITYLFWGYFFRQQKRERMFVYQNIYLLIFYATVLASGYVR